MFTPPKIIFFHETRSFPQKFPLKTPHPETKKEKTHSSQTKHWVVPDHQGGIHKTRTSPGLEVNVSPCFHSWKWFDFFTHFPGNPRNMVSPKKKNPPTIHFQGRTVRFREVRKDLGFPSWNGLPTIHSHAHASGFTNENWLSIECHLMGVQNAKPQAIPQTKYHQRIPPCP